MALTCSTQLVGGGGGRLGRLAGGRGGAAAHGLAGKQLAAGSGRACTLSCPLLLRARSRRRARNRKCGGHSGCSAPNSDLRQAGRTGGALWVRVRLAAGSSLATAEQGGRAAAAAGPGGAGAGARLARLKLRYMVGTRTSTMAKTVNTGKSAASSGWTCTMGCSSGGGEEMRGGRSDGDARLASGQASGHRRRLTAMACTPSHSSTSASPL